MSNRLIYVAFVIALLSIIMGGLFGSNSLKHLNLLKTDIAEIKKQEKEILSKVIRLETEAASVTYSNFELEREARTQLGMIKNGERVYMIKRLNSKKQ